jgi:UDP-N-acetylmuramoyl-tripeptide--D-alanyl-D-alanine ligase
LEFSFLLNGTDGKLVSGEGRGQLSGVSTDTRKISRGEVFFALRGESFDGHKFIDEAFRKGASAAVVEEVPKNLNSTGALVQVGSTLRALGDLAKTWRNSLSEIELAAITGSNGKTTTKEMVSSIISLNHSTLKNSGNFNNLIGLPLTLLELNESVEMAVVELGMNDFGEIRRLSQIARPDVGAITNIGRAHLEKLGGIEGVAKAKGELVEGLHKNSFFVVNADDPRVQKVADDTNFRKITYGIESAGSFITGDSIEEKDFSGIKFYMSVAGEGFPVTLHTIGVHNVMNALCAAGIAYGLGCVADEIREGLEKFKPVHLRLEVCDTPQGFKVINDSYNANPDSMRSAIDELMRLKGGGRAVAVIGDMLELGEASESEHRGIGEYLSSSGVDYVITYGNFGATVLDSLSNGTAGVYAATHEEAASALRSYADKDDLVLIKGSRGMRMEEVIKNLS